MNTMTNKHPETEEVVASINECLDCIKQLDDCHLLNYYPLAYMQIFVKFQKLLYSQFEMYCLGKVSSSGYCPARKHLFDDEIELRAFLKTKTEYIDYDDRISELSEYIFNDSPFAKLFCLEPQGYVMLKHIRNHIAHESPSSYKKLYDARILKDNQTIGQYFAGRSKKNTIRFNELIKSIYDFSNYIIEG